jgi:hypothetical protein
MVPVFCALGVVALLMALVVLGRPDAFVVSRSATMPVPAGRLFALVNDLHAWNEWSPWAKLDPASTATFAGPDQGVGASMAWSGNAKVGVGRMTIVESRPDTVIRLRLEFEKPMKATNISAFTFVPDGQGTHVTWTMSGTNDLAGKIFGTLVDCDRMVGAQFEKGLADLERAGATERRGS